MNKLLLIEDDDVKAKDIMDFIEKEYHFDIDRKDSITAGLRVINNNYDYILLDMSLPRFSENSLRNFEPFGGLEVIKEMIEYLHKYVYPLVSMEHSGFDVLGRFYTEFIRYAGSEQKQGLVLTPFHITDLFCDLANITEYLPRVSCRDWG